MGSWFKRQQPIRLEQWSELPYVILKDGVFLCFDNCYGETGNKEHHHIVFNTCKAALSRRSTNFFKLIQFPCLIPFRDVIQVDGLKFDGTIKKSERNSATKSITVIRGSYAEKYSDDIEFSAYDDNFILVKDNIPYAVYDMVKQAKVIQHRQWNRTAVTMADKICSTAFRGHCWTNLVGSLSVDCFGLNRNDIDNLCESFDSNGICDFSTRWAD